jgi:hypothetical protein
MQLSVRFLFNDSLSYPSTTTDLFLSLKDHRQVRMLLHVNGYAVGTDPTLRIKFFLYY